VYGTLRQLEKTGLVSSFWDTSESGPARRMYSLTKAGDLFLSGWIDVLSNYQKVLREALERMNPVAVEAEGESVDDDGPGAA
jgi:poly-beta-hydroxybutyrate-responsive repressor